MSEEQQKFSYHGIEVVGEGAQKTEAEIPVSIRCDKVLEWLCDRNVCAKNWSSQAAQCRKELSALLQSGGALFDVAEAKGEEGYVAAAAGLSSLLQSHKDHSRGFLGGYNDPVLNACEAVWYRYRKNNCHLAECAQNLLQLQKYELAAARKELEQLQRQSTDLEKLRARFEMDAKEFERQYQRSCKELGISPTGDVVRELEGLTSRLDGYYAQFEQASRAPLVVRALKYYKLFVQYVSSTVSGSNGDKPSVSLCPTLSFVMEKGNVRQDSGNSKANEGNANAKQKEEEKPIEIDWGIEDTTPATSIQGGGDGIEVVPEISWDVGIDVVEEVATIEDVPQDAGNGTILSTAEGRGAFLDEVYELLSFIDGRLRERMGLASNKVAASDALFASTDCPEELRACEIYETLLQLREAVHGVTRIAEGEEFQRLLQIQKSKSYVNRLAVSVRKKLDLAHQSLEQAKTVKERIASLADDAEIVRQRSNKIGKKSQHLKQLIEKELGEHLKRKVNIII